MIFEDSTRHRSSVEPDSPIAVIADDRRMTQWLCDAIQNNDCVVTESLSTEQALFAHKRRRFDMIITDLHTVVETNLVGLLRRLSPSSRFAVGSKWGHLAEESLRFHDLQPIERYGASGNMENVVLYDTRKLAP